MKRPAVTKKVIRSLRSLADAVDEQVFKERGEHIRRAKKFVRNLETWRRGLDEARKAEVSKS